MFLIGILVFIVVYGNVCFQHIWYITLFIATYIFFSFFLFFSFYSSFTIQLYQAIHLMMAYSTTVSLPISFYYIVSTSNHLMWNHCSSWWVFFYHYSQRFLVCLFVCLYAIPFSSFIRSFVRITFVQMTLLFSRFDFVWEKIIIFFCIQVAQFIAFNWIYV